MITEKSNPRRKFIGTLAAGATPGIAGMPNPLLAKAGFKSKVSGNRRFLGQLIIQSF